MSLTKHILNEISEQKLKSVREQFLRRSQGKNESHFDMLVQADPTPNGTYLNWLVNLYFTSVIPQGGLDSVKPYLELLYKYKDKIKNMGIETDINKYEEIDEFKDALKTALEVTTDLPSGLSTKLYEDDEWLLVIPKTQEVACKYGKATTWCTTVTKSFGNRFDRYNDTGHLYILISKKTREKWQWHYFQHQFVDDQNQDVDPTSVISRTPKQIQDLFDFEVWNNPYLRKLKSDEEIGILKDGVYDGWFEYTDNGLESLEGSPHTITRSFIVSHNNLTSLKGAPTSVGTFVCKLNKLTTLEGAPTNVEKHFNCSGNDLKNLVGAPKEIDGDFNCSDNQLISLEGAPTFVGGNFNCAGNSNLSKKEILKYKKTGAVKGTIYHDL